MLKSLRSDHDQLQRHHTEINKKLEQRDDLIQKLNAEVQRLKARNNDKGELPEVKEGGGTSRGSRGAKTGRVDQVQCSATKHNGIKNLNCYAPGKAQYVDAFSLGPTNSNCHFRWLVFLFVCFHEFNDIKKDVAESLA